LPGECRVNYRNATDATAHMAEALDQALWPAARRPSRAALWRAYEGRITGLDGKISFNSDQKSIMKLSPCRYIP
jgi:hypothetical protein